MSAFTQNENFKQPLLLFKSMLIYRNFGAADKRIKRL